jgi:hypothetical protein
MRMINKLSNGNVEIGILRHYDAFPLKILFVKNRFRLATFSVPPSLGFGFRKDYGIWIHFYKLGIILNTHYY